MNERYERSMLWAEARTAGTTTRSRSEWIRTTPEIARWIDEDDAYEARLREERERPWRELSESWNELVTPFANWLERQLARFDRK